MFSAFLPGDFFFSFCILCPDRISRALSSAPQTHRSRQKHLELKYKARSLQGGHTRTRPTSIYAARSGGPAVPTGRPPGLQLPTGMRNGRCAFRTHPDPPTSGAPLSDFPGKRVRRRRRTARERARWGAGGRGVAAPRTYLGRVRGSPAGGRAGGREAEHRGTERPASGAGARAAALISLSPGDPPTRRGRGLRKTGLRQLGPGFSLITATSPQSLAGFRFIRCFPSHREGWLQRLRVSHFVKCHPSMVCGGHSKVDNWLFNRWTVKGHHFCFILCCYISLDKVNQKRLFRSCLDVQSCVVLSQTPQKCFVILNILSFYRSALQILNSLGPLITCEGDIF